MEGVEPLPWGPPAAYLYILKLDAPSLAWEYLRRNQVYASEYALVSNSKKHFIAPTAWGLLHWEDPRVDSRSVQPCWIAPTEPEVVLTKGPIDCPSLRFDFWRIAGWKILMQVGGVVCLIAHRGSQILYRASWPEHLSLGDPLCIALPAGRGFTARVRAAQALLQSQRGAVSVPHLSRPSIQAITHMQTLQALDGAASGASHRDIARHIFGKRSASAEERWEGDSPLRARVRYLIRCGRIRSNYGYRGIGTSGRRKLAAADQSRKSPSTGGYA